MAPRKAPPQPKVYAEAYAEHRAAPQSAGDTYVVQGTHAVHGHLPGELITLPQHVAFSLVASGNLVPAKTPVPQGDPEDQDPGQLPELNESE